LQIFPRLAAVAVCYSELLASSDWFIVELGLLRLAGSGTVVMVL